MVMPYTGLLFLGHRPGKDLDEKLIKLGLEKIPLQRRFLGKGIKVRVKTNGYLRRIFLGLHLEAVVNFWAEKESDALRVYRTVNKYAMDKGIPRGGLEPIFFHPR